MTEENQDLLLIEKKDGIAIVRINRPEALNVLKHSMLVELMDTLEALDDDPDVRAIVLTGTEKAFVAGADISEFGNFSTAEMKAGDRIGVFARINQVRKPVIGAVSGWSLGGGCELALSCDMLIASETAKFGQPEITLGFMTGAGASQRLTHTIGKYLAMEMILNNRTLTAKKALQHGLVNAVYPVEQYLDAAIKLAVEIAARAPLAVLEAKQAVNLAFEMHMTEGLDTEREMFYELFDTEDQKEGVKAFMEKRKPEWKGK